MSARINRSDILEALKCMRAPTSDFDLNEEARQNSNRLLNPASVLVPIRDAASGPELILTKRASTLRHHPGQISFPGGRADKDDLNVVDTALREAEEEIGLPKNIVDILGTAPTHETVTGFQMTPVFGWIRDEFPVHKEAGEVSEVFTVPLSHVADPRNYVIQSRQWRGMPRYYFTVPFGPYYIWGATARILRHFADGMTVK